MERGALREEVGGGGGQGGGGEEVLGFAQTECGATNVK